MVAASYNRGMAGMSRAMKNQEEENYYNLMLNQETSRYLFRILAIKEIFENPSKYSFDISEEHMYKPYSLHYLEVTLSSPFYFSRFYPYRLLGQSDAHAVTLTPYVSG